MRERQDVEGGEAVLGRIDDGLHEGDAVSTGAGQLAGRIICKAHGYRPRGPSSTGEGITRHFPPLRF